MSDQIRDTAEQFSRQAAAYAASPTHARGDDLDLVLDFAAPASGETCLDLAPPAPATPPRAYPPWRGLSPAWTSPPG